MFEKFKNPSFSSRCVYLMSISKSQAAEEVNEIETAINSVKSASIDILEISPVSCEIVIGIG
jgi:hypothetical protein